MDAGAQELKAVWVEEEKLSKGNVFGLICMDFSRKGSFVIVLSVNGFEDDPSQGSTQHKSFGLPIARVLAHDDERIC